MKTRYRTTLLSLLALAGAIAAALPASAAAQFTTPPGGSRPNIVVIMTDDQTAASMRVMNQTNSLLGASGTRFQNAVATFPLCCPSRATYMTGQYSHNHGVTHNAGPRGGYKRLRHANALPVWLQSAGYRTIQLGRSLNGYGTNGVSPTEIPPGWSDWHATIDPTTFHYRNWLMNDNGTVNGYPDRPGEHQNDFFGRRAAELISAAAPSPQPFFLSLTFPAPHSGAPREDDDPAEMRTPVPADRHRNAFAAEPLPRTPDFDEADVSDKPRMVYDRPRLTPEWQRAVEENYRQELETLLSVDDAVAKVVEALVASGEFENTLIVYTSDNGYMHGEHRWPTEKVLPYEPSIRVPLLVRGPGVPRGRVDRRLAANIDLAPTIVDAAEARPGRLMDGRSLFELMTDPGRQWGRDILLEDGYGANRVPAYRAIRNDRYLYVKYLFTGEYELYDLARDPYQLNNLDGDLRYVDVQAELARRLGRLKRCRGAPCSAGPTLNLVIRSAQRRKGRSRAPAHRGGCVRSGVRAEVAGLDTPVIKRIDFLVGRRRVARDRRRPFAGTIDRRRLRGRAVRLRARAYGRYGRVVTLDRTLRICGR